MDRGKLIVVEGIDGSGKTTLLGNLVDVTRKRFGSPIRVLQTYEPTHGRIGLLARELFVLGEEDPVQWMERELLLAADRMRHIREVIEPELAKGTWVFCDRYIGSGYAYALACAPLMWRHKQQTERAIDKLLKNLYQLAPRADVTLYVDLGIAEALKRTSERRETSAYDRDEEFLRRVMYGYQSASLQLEEVWDRISTMEECVQDLADREGHRARVALIAYKTMMNRLYLNASRT